jgi:hypothetical protein
MVRLDGEGMKREDIVKQLASDVLQRLPDSAELDARIAAAFAEDAESVDVSRLLPEVEARQRRRRRSGGGPRAGVGPAALPR